MTNYGSFPPFVSHRIHGAAIYGNIYHQYTPNVIIYSIHGSYGYTKKISSNIETPSRSRRISSFLITSLQHSAPRLAPEQGSSLAAGGPKTTPNRWGKSWVHGQNVDASNLPSSKMSKIQNHHRITTFWGQQILDIIGLDWRWMKFTKHH